MDGTGAVTQGEDQGLALLGQGINLLGNVVKSIATPGPVKVGPQAGPAPTNEQATQKPAQAAIPVWVYWAGGALLVGTLVYVAVK